MKKQRNEIGSRHAALLVAVLLLGACTTTDGPSSPRVLNTGVVRGFITEPSVWDALTTPRQVDPEFIEVCKDFAGAGATANSTADFTVSGTSTPQGAGAQSVGPFDFTLGNGECREIFVSEIHVITDLTIGEVGPFAAGAATTVQVTSLSAGVTTTGSDVSATSAVATTGPGAGALVVFTNVVPSTAGCTRTLGYWKNHPSEWNDAGDANAAAFVTGATFFASGRSYLAVLNTPPRGNAYYILAHQYIAALLNGGAGASATAQVHTALTGAQAYFGGAWTARDQLIAWAGQLASYNEGLTGPGYCPE